MGVESPTNPTPLPPTPDGWCVRKIEELCDRVTSGGTPSRARPEFYQNGVVNWFKTKELKDCSLYESEEKISQEGLASSSAKVFPPDTVLMALYGDGKTITSLGILRREAATNQACCAMIPSGRHCIARFLFYSLLFHRNDFLQVATGGAQRNLSGQLIRRFSINTPPLAEQIAIARVLGTLDDKIELNRRMNATLEAMARALFQSWFVDFDPVRAKLDGRKPAGIDAAIAAHFPASFQESKLGRIPKGWEIGSILRQADLLSGGTPKTDVPAYWNGDVPWASAKDVSQCGEAFLVTTERTITKLGVDESSTKIIPAFATVVVARGATTGRLTMFGHSMAMNQTCYGLRSKVDAPFVLYCNARHFIERLVQGGHGSIFDTITTSTFEATEVLLPPKQVLLAFDQQVAPLFQQVCANLHQSRTLATLRDTLLPKLLSGELQVNTHTDDGK